MNEAMIWICGGALLLLGFIGCLLPVVPGPLLGYASLWVMWAFGVNPGTERLWIGGALVLVVSAIDYVLPSMFAKKFKCSKSGIVGCFLGTIVGVLFMPWGLVLGPVLGAMLGELTAGRSLYEATRGGLGALCGFVSCLLAKLAATGIFAGWFVRTMTG